MKSVRAVAVLARTVVVVAAVAAGGVVIAMLVGVTLPNPLSTTHVDRDHTAMVERLRDVSRYTAATEHLQVVVDAEEHADHLPAGLKGERVVFVAEGDVPASVDFSGLTADGVDVSADGTSATVHLPEPTLEAPRLDPHKSSVVTRERGLIDRVGDAVSGSSSTNDQKYYEAAEAKIADSAEHSDLRDRARANTETFVTDLFESAGYTHVTVQFDRPAPGAAAA